MINFYIKRFFGISLLIVSVLLTNNILCQQNDSDLNAKILNSIDKSVEFFHSINIHGGYVYYYTEDLSRRWGEEECDENTIEVQPPGTPAVGLSFLKAFLATGEEKFLSYAEETAHALIAGQNVYGGWDHTISFDKNSKDDPIVSFDDNQTQSAIEFLIAMNKYSDDLLIKQSVIKAMNLMMDSQLELGGWPHYYPEQGNYHDYATFNDGGINDCLNVMIKAYRHYKNKKYLASIKIAGDYICISQLAPPQSGWAQQYNKFLQPAWARTFEPPSVCPQVTLRNINSLLDIYILTNDEKYLEPIPDAIRWLNDTRLPNNKWARFIAIGSGEPLYYDRGRIKVDSVDKLSVERRKTYGYEQDLKSFLDSTVSRYNSIENEKKTFGKDEVDLVFDKSPKITPEQFEDIVLKIINSLDEKGRWLSLNNRYKDKKPDKRWDGNYLTADRISSYIFNLNIDILTRYLMITKNTN